MVRPVDPWPPTCPREYPYSPVRVENKTFIEHSGGYRDPPKVTESVIIQKPNYFLKVKLFFLENCKRTMLYLHKNGK